MTQGDGVSDSLFFHRYNEPVTPSRGVKKLANQLKMSKSVIVD